MRRRALIALVACFLLFWLFGMVSSFATSHCLNGASTSSRTIRACEFSKMTFPMLDRLEGQKKPGAGVIFTQYGLVSLQSGEPEEAAEWIKRGLQRAIQTSHLVELNDGLKVPEGVLSVLQKVHHEQVLDDVRAEWWSIGLTVDPALLQPIFDAATKPTEEALRDDLVPFSSAFLFRNSPVRVSTHRLWVRFRPHPHFPSDTHN